MRLLLAAAALLLASCAAPVALPDTAGADVVLVGEQHDAQSHPRLHEEVVQGLARRGALAGLAIEMADQGSSTRDLPATASEEQVRAALHWDERGWPWARYQPAIMAAVHAGVPVLGANLPRPQLRQAMQDAALDRALPGPALKAQQQAVRLGHCGMLPEQQIGPMTRVQIARDQAMAQTIQSLLAPGKTVVLLAGSGHVEPGVGVPLHLPPGLAVRSIELPKQDTGKDYCAEFRRESGGGMGRS